MRAIVQDKYGRPETLVLRALEEPVAKAGQVRLRVHAAAVNPADCLIVRGRPYVMRMMTGLLKPRSGVRGLDVAGRVEAVGRNVKRLQVGDDVFGWCDGACAEYACAGEADLTLKPAGLTFAEASTVGVAAFAALQGLRDTGELQPGQKVLINGASGGVGTFAAQIAKSFGAEVTGVCSTRNVDMVRSIGADHVIDYTQEDFTRSPLCQRT